MFFTRALLAYHATVPSTPKYGLPLRKQIKQAKKLGFKGRDQLRTAFGIFGNQRWWRGFYWTQRYKWEEHRWFKVWKTADAKYIFYSNALNAVIEFRTTRRVKNDIDHFGGLDNYLLATWHRLGPRALATKKMIKARVDELKACGQWKPFPGLKDGPDFPDSFVNQLKLDRFVREGMKAQLSTVVKEDEYAEAVKDIPPVRIPFIPHEIAGEQLYIE